MEYQFPREFKKLIGALSDNNRWKILESIINSENKASYSEIKKALGIPDSKKGSFNYHLKELQKSGLIRRFITTEADGPARSYYTISQFGRKALEGALKSFNEKEYKTKEELFKGWPVHVKA